MSSQLFKSLKHVWHNQGTFKFYNSCVVFRPRVGYNRGIAVSAPQTARKKKLRINGILTARKGVFPMMKKSTFGAVLAFFFAAAGALTAAALYLYHREKELDEYERLLFSDDGDDYDDDDDFQDDTVYEKIPAQPAADAPDAADAE